MTPLEFPLTFERVTERQLNSEKLKTQLHYIMDAAERNRTFNFTAKPLSGRNVNVEKTGGLDHPVYHYTAVVTVVKATYRNAGSVREQLEQVKATMSGAANKVRWKFVGEGKPGEITKPAPEAPIVEDDETGEKPDKLPKVIKSRTELDLPPLTDDVYQRYFGRLFNREPHVRLIYDAIKQAQQTGFKERNHVLLRGLAGCAKTEVLGGKNVSGGFYEWLGGEANIWEVDSTTLTKAGLERELLRRSKDSVLPPIIKLEEIEKVTEPRTVNCLLQVMDVRGRIQRTNARDGDEFGDCKVLVLATCNDSKLLRKFADGALWSRFSMRPICKRPDQETMTKILMRVCKETAEMGGYCGTEEHVNKVVSFMWDRLREMKEYAQDYNDPRLGRALLSGGDRILDGGPTNSLEDFLKVCQGDESGEDDE